MLIRLPPVEIMLKENADWMEATERHRSSDAGVQLENFVTAQLI